MTHALSFYDFGRDYISILANIQETKVLESFITGFIFVCMNVTESFSYLFFHNIAR